MPTTMGGPLVYQMDEVRLPTGAAAARAQQRARIWRIGVPSTAVRRECGVDEIELPFAAGRHPFALRCTQADVINPVTERASWYKRF